MDLMQISAQIIMLDDTVTDPNTYIIGSVPTNECFTPQIYGTAGEQRSEVCAHYARGGRCVIRDWEGLEVHLPHSEQR